MTSGRSLQTRTKCARVLVADDHDVVRRGLRVVLTDAGHEVCGEASTGRRVQKFTIQRLPQHELIGVTNTVVVSLAFGGLLYFFLRAPFLVHHAIGIHQRWKRIKQHRVELEAWSRKQRERAKQKPPIEPSRV